MRLREQSHFYHIQETISIFKHGIAVLQAFVVDGSLAADELGTDTGGQNDGLTDMVLLQADRNGHLFQVHTDQRAADIKARGVKFGRPPLPLLENFYEVHRAWRNKELTLQQAASACGMPAGTFYGKAVKFEKGGKGEVRGI